MHSGSKYGLKAYSRLWYSRICAEKER